MTRKISSYIYDAVDHDQFMKTCDRQIISGDVDHIVYYGILVFFENFSDLKGVIEVSLHGEFQ